MPNKRSHVRRRALARIAAALGLNLVCCAALVAQSHRGGDPAKLFGRRIKAAPVSLPLPVLDARAPRAATEGEDTLADPNLPVQGLQPGGLPNRNEIGRSSEGDDGADEDESEERTRLFGPLIPEDCGLTIEPIYWGEVFNNARGGLSTNGATQYQALLDISITLELEKTPLPIPGRFFMLVQNSHGRGLTEEFVGDFQTFSNIDSGDNITQVSEYWYEVPVLGEALTVRLGKQDLNTEFLVTELAGDFIQSSFGIIPTLALPTFPTPSAAAVLLADLDDRTTLRLGVWDGFPEFGTWGFSGTGTTLSIGEIERRWSLCGDRFPGAMDIGVAYLSGGLDPLGVRVPFQTGYYVQAEQIVWRENCRDEEDSQGLGCFFQYASITPRQTVDLTDSFNLGLLYQGLLPGRDDDLIGVGVANAWLNLGGSGRETVTEVFYKAQIRPWMMIQPDVQFIATPSGLLRDALVVGARFEVAW